MKRILTTIRLICTQNEDGTFNEPEMVSMTNIMKGKEAEHKFYGENNEVLLNDWEKEQFNIQGGVFATDFNTLLEQAEKFSELE